MSQEFVYQFDINGYVVIPAAIPQPHLQRLQGYWCKNLIGHPLHDVNFDWGDDWRGLIDIESVYSFLDIVYRSKFRLDHCFVPMSASSAAVANCTTRRTCSTKASITGCEIDAFTAALSRFNTQYRTSGKRRTTSAAFQGHIGPTSRFRTGTETSRTICCYATSFSKPGTPWSSPKRSFTERSKSQTQARGEVCLLGT